MLTWQPEIELIEFVLVGRNPGTLDLSKLYVEYIFELKFKKYNIMSETPEEMFNKYYTPEDFSKFEWRILHYMCET
jgi:hypothetical protein